MVPTVQSLSFADPSHRERVHLRAGVAGLGLFGVSASVIGVESARAHSIFIALLCGCAVAHDCLFAGHVS